MIDISGTIISRRSLFTETLDPYKIENIDKTIPKLTVNNMYMLMYISFREVIQGYSTMRPYGSSLNFWKTHYISMWGMILFAAYDRLFNFILTIHPNSAHDILRFTTKNKYL